MRFVRALALLLALAGPARADNGDFGFDPRLGAPLPEAAVLRDEQGRTVTLGSVIGGVPSILALGYFHCPNLCGVVRDDVLSALERAGLHARIDYRLVVLSIDPNETPADAAAAKEGALSRYPDPDADAGWRFLTGPASGIEAIAGATGFRSRFNPTVEQFLHPAGIIVVNPAGVISTYLLGVGYAPGDLRSAVLRAGQGGVADAISPVLLLCFHFDPATGRYNFAIYRTLSVMAALTVVTLGGTLVLLHRRDRRGA
jgi:protein SCO1/2